MNPPGRRRSALLVFTSALSLYILTAGGSLTSTDAVVAFDLTASLVDRHSIALSGNILGLETNRGVDGRFYSQYGIGQSLYNVPFYVAGKAAQDAIGRRIGKPDTIPKAAVALGSAVAAAACVLLVWWLSLHLVADERAAFVAAASAAVASPLWPYSKFGFSTALTTAILLGSACLLADAADRRETWPAAAAGAVVGFGWLTRHEMALVLAPFAAFLVLAAGERPPSRQTWRQAGAFLACASVGGLLWIWYNVARFGGPFSVGYSPRFDDSGYVAFLVSPAGSVVLFAPIAIVWLAGLLAPGAASAARRILLVGPLLVFYVFYGALADWPGGRSYGPRYLVPALLLLAPGAALFWRRGGWRRTVLVAAIALGAVLQLPGVLVDYSKVSVDWARSATRGDIEARNWRLAASPFVLGAGAALRAVPANVSYLIGRASPPEVATTATADNRDFAQQLSFSLDFWWVYLVYLRALSIGKALTIATVLAIVSMACAAGAWRSERGEY
jgi:dolichyl-phosphate-mannose-protein mannosyltransferase